ncbi:hypothetical protein [Saccharothrix variisporea]|uniref:Uncharacterized protein n=1 Tax=Saccharothrix variisporea TaxID=543527 RepID=A0A495WZG6_9PSEU|nr:hypothetical protein [Saccharothrix variisporea]RKT67092.1 hypothetical protein DFJ66_0260 [Saccharothrix variisporea]
MIKQRKWPNANDTALQRRTQIAHSYRAVLMDVAPERCAVLDRAAEALGENWIAPALVTDDAEKMTLTQCAKAVGAKAGTLWQWANRGVVPRNPDGSFTLTDVQRALSERTRRDAPEPPRVA